MKTLRLTLLGFGLVVLTTSAPAASFSESVHGDISDDGLSPTLWSLDIGANVLNYSVQGSPRDLDYLRIDLPTGSYLNAIWLDGYNGGDTRAFIGVMNGPQFTVPANEAVFRVGEILGYTLFGTAADAVQVGQDLLLPMSTGGLAQGFTPPLTGESYTFWFDQLGPSTDVTLRFEVTAVPEPTAATLLLGGALVFVVRRRKRSH